MLWQQKHLQNRYGNTVHDPSQPLPAGITTNRMQPSSPMMWGMRLLRRNGRLPTMGGYVRSSGLIVVWRRKHLQNCQYYTQPLTPLPARITKNRMQPLLPMMWGTRALPQNGRLPAMGDGRGPVVCPCCGGENTYKIAMAELNPSQPSQLESQQTKHRRHCP
jgi:hypothetical protein